MKKPGMLAFQPDVSYSIIRGDSFEELLRHPFILTGQVANTNKLALRGQIMSYDEATEIWSPIFVMEIKSSASAGVYTGVQYGKVSVGDTVHVMKADGTGGVDAEVTAVEYSENTDSVIEARSMTITVDYGAGTEPANAALILFEAMENATMDGIVYESFDDVNIPIALDIMGARPERICGGSTAFVQEGLGAIVRCDAFLWSAF